MNDRLREQEQYEKVKRDVMEAIAEIEKAIPEAGPYLREHLVFDDEKLTVKYTGDNRFQMRQVVAPSN